MERKVILELDESTFSRQSISPPRRAKNLRFHTYPPLEFLPFFARYELLQISTSSLTTGGLLVGESKKDNCSFNEAASTMIGEVSCSSDFCRTKCLSTDESATRKFVVKNWTKSASPGTNSRILSMYASKSRFLASKGLLLFSEKMFFSGEY